MSKPPRKIAVWALTPKGAALAKQIRDGLPESVLFLSESLDATPEKARTFSGIVKALSECFRQFSGHVFIMSTGIAVRAIAPLIRHKTLDPAVVVADEAGRYAISLLSGMWEGPTLWPGRLPTSSGPSRSSLRRRISTPCPPWTP